MNERAGLDASGIRVVFGGLVAVDGVSLVAPVGSITGLIGPNGAGKTTMFNACTGVLRSHEGTVHFDGADVTGEPAQARARRGIGRTFQRMELFDSLTVAENVALGREAGLAGSHPWRQLFSPRRDRAEVEAAAAEAMDLCGITALGDHVAGALSTGQRRLVELARVLAGPFRLLLLDEPSSGLDAAETERFGAILTAAVAERGLGILLVEHDMSLVMRVCEHLYVLDFGQLVFQGTPDEVRDSPVVRAAYLGSEAA